MSVIDASASATSDDLARPAPRIRAVLVCDLADSTALIERLGDRAAADLMRRHDRVARDLMQQHGGQEIDKTDGFLVLFERPVQAVAFALAYQRALRALGEELHQPLRARIGLHVGEVVLWDNVAADIADGAKPVEVEGLAKPVAARLMSLALPGQVLLSETARTLAQRAHAELPGAERVRWLTHGRYRFKGVPVPMMVHEVGETGVAVLVPPPSSSKAQRELPWWRRPAALIAEVVVLATAIAVPLYFTFRSPSAIAFAERDWVVLADVGNLTSQPLLTDSLDVALRIGLEQSRYVNVVPTTSVRETLKRMRRAADSPIDRAAGVEIAQREGARALILPTVAEVGGRVRVTAEVIDPISGDTVYSDAAGGEGLDSVLGSTDELLERLRERLGESIASIERDNQPLAQITTDSLDALKAFALGEAALGEGRLKDAMALLNEAVGIDPDFAMAHARLSTLHHALGDDASAHRAAQQALSRQQHLSTRERLMLEGVGSFYSAPSQAHEKWNTLLSLYPDTPVAQNNIGLATLWFENDPAAAAPHFREFRAGQQPVARLRLARPRPVSDDAGELRRRTPGLRRGRASGRDGAEFRRRAAADRAARLRARPGPPRWRRAQPATGLCARTPGAQGRDRARQRPLRHRRDAAERRARRPAARIPAGFAPTRGAAAGHLAGAHRCGGGACDAGRAGRHRARTAGGRGGEFRSLAAAASGIGRAARAAPR